MSRSFNPLSANPTKWPNTLKQFVGKLPTNCLSVFGHFVNLVLKIVSPNTSVKGTDFSYISDMINRIISSKCYLSFLPFVLPFAYFHIDILVEDNLV